MDSRSSLFLLLLAFSLASVLNAQPPSNDTCSCDTPFTVSTFNTLQIFISSGQNERLNATVQFFSEPEQQDIGKVHLYIYSNGWTRPSRRSICSIIVTYSIIIQLFVRCSLPPRAVGSYAKRWSSSFTRCYLSILLSCPSIPTGWSNEQHPSIPSFHHSNLLVFPVLTLSCWSALYIIIELYQRMYFGTNHALPRMPR